VGSLNYTETNLDKVINPKVSALFVFLLAVFVYMFFALQTAEAQTLTVQVNVNGLATTQTTTQRTVGELIDSLYPDASQIISLLPDRSTEISPNLDIKIVVKPTKLNPVVAKNLETSRESAAKPIVVATAPKIAKVTPKPVQVAKVEPKSPTYSGTATWYRFGNGLTTASTQFPKGTRLRVVADTSGKYVDVEVNDYGPTADTGVSLDLNKPAFLKLAPLGAGRVNVRYYII
jgi:rare lipoprotein A (peptidoglycan hydrolase)